MTAISSYTVETSNVMKTHEHAHAHIILPIKGVFRISFLEQYCELSPQQIGFCPPGVRHAYQCSGESLVLNIPREMVKTVDLASLKERPFLKVDDRLQPLVYLIMQEVNENSGNQDSLRYLFYYLYDKFVERQFMPSLKYLNENYASAELSIASLAEMENYNVSYYTEWFKNRMGVTPSEYLRNLRLAKAREILSTTHYPITDVAMQVGYANASAFSRAFRENVHMTPMQYRRRQRLNPGSGRKRDTSDTGE